MKSKIICFLSIAFITNSFAQIDSYSYKRKLNAIAKEGYYSIPLLPEVTAQCSSNLYDINMGKFYHYAVTGGLNSNLSRHIPF